MKSFTRARVIKSCKVEVDRPRTIQPTIDFEALIQHLQTLKTESLLFEESENPSETEETEISIQQSSLVAEAQNTLQTARLEAEKLLHEAREQAEKIVQTAHSEAQAILEQARIEAEGYKDQLAESIRAEISEQAYAEGFERGHREGRQAAEEIIRRAEDTFSLATKALQREYTRAEDYLISLSIKIAERILRTELAVRPQKLQSIIKSLLSLPHERQGWRLHVSYEDAAWLKNLEPELALPLVESDNLRPGDCMLECEDGLFDARLASQLKVIEESLREEFRSGELEQPAAKN